MYDIVSYTKSSSNEYKLTLLAQDADSSKGDGKTKLVENGESGLTDTAFSNANKGTSDKTTASYANGKTTFLIATPGSNGTEYRVYEGIKNVPDVVISSGKTIEVSTYVEKGNAARVIFINATTDATVSGSSDDIVFIKGSGTGASYDSKLGTYYEYDAIINGEFTTIKTADRFKTSGLYNIVSYDKNGVATNLDKDSNVKSGTGTERVKNDVVGLGDGAAMKYYAYSKDCQVFHLDEDGDIDETVYTVSNIATDNNDKVWYVMDSGDVIAIVYQDQPDGAATPSSAYIVANGSFGVIINSTTQTVNTNTNSLFVSATENGRGDTASSNVVVSYEISTWNGSTNSWNDSVTVSSAKQSTVAAGTYIDAGTNAQATYDGVASAGVRCRVVVTVTCDQVTRTLPAVVVTSA